MPLKTSVKVSHLSNLSDARYCAGMGVNMLGFGVIPGSPHYMTPQLFQDIRGWVAGPAIVAEVYGLSGQETEIREIMQKYAPDYFELSLEEYRKFHTILPLPCIVDMAAVPEAATLPDDGKIAYVVVDGSCSCRDIAGFSNPVFVRIAGADQLRDKLGSGCFKGVVLEGPPEQRPGITNYDQLGEILEALEED